MSANGRLRELDDRAAARFEHRREAAAVHAGTPEGSRTRSGGRMAGWPSYTGWAASLRVLTKLDDYVLPRIARASRRRRWLVGGGIYTGVGLAVGFALGYPGEFLIAMLAYGAPALLIASAHARRRRRATGEVPAAKGPTSAN